MKRLRIQPEFIGRYADDDGIVREHISTETVKAEHRAGGHTYSLPMYKVSKKKLKEMYEE
jgi:hypothetical protein